MDQQKIATEMIEFNKAVEQLWATYDRAQKEYYEDETAHTTFFHFIRTHNKTK